MVRLFNYSDQYSFPNKLRRKRLAHFWWFVRGSKRPLKIIDVGGTEEFWKNVGLDDGRIKITLLNLKKIPTRNRNFISVKGNAKSMMKFKAKSFDIAFSNSVIEHLGSWRGCRKMAREMRRVGKKYYLQTPNKHFPIEPHFIFPFFQYLPFGVKVWLISHFNLGHVGRQNKESAKRIARSIYLLTKRDLQRLFPQGQIVEEKFWGITKSFIVFGENGASPSRWGKKI